MLCSLSKIESSSLEAIQSLENDLGKPLLAFSCYDINPAIVEDKELEQINALEKNWV
jgi:hypothetical protein